MILQLEMGPNFQQVVRELGAMGQALLNACSTGLEKGTKLAAGKVASDYLSGQSLKRRSGLLAKAVDGWMAGDFEGVVGIRDNTAVNKYKWLLGDEQKTITPKKGKYLTIPIGEALTSSGTLKGQYSGGLRNIEGGFFVRTGGKLLFGFKRGKRGKFRPLFALVKSVTIKGSNALYEGVTDSLDDMTDAIETEIARRTGAV